MTSAILSERGRSHRDDAACASTHLTPAQSGAAIVQPCQPASGSYSPTAGPTRATGIAPRLNTRVSVGAQLATVAVGLVAAVGCIVLAVFDPRKESFYPRCPFRAVTGRACAGCGITRGLHQLLTGHPVAALRLNLLLAVLVPASVYGYVAWTVRRWGGPKLPTIRLTSRNITGGIVVLLLFTVLRNLPWGPFHTFSALY